ncbi:hypothetical protein FSP39_015678 [Pinctada imbricata]|uniref:Integrase catalytic domain-containing protein n=1 Tax=Pinctada imbricata TaxID=66713 RepID=A0AA88XMK4_PINIB|nr:hypothetical protein FSP39_015678 [Pinctada imbricata]
MRRKQKEPDKFDGQSVDFRDYIVQFEQIANWNGWTSAEMAQQLTMNLSGEARKLLGHIEKSKLADYNRLKDVLLNRFCPPERKAAYATEFYSRVRKPNENIDEFGYALRRLWYLAFPNEGSSYVHLIKAFVNGLSDLEMKKHISLSHPETLEAAIGLAIEFEAVVNSFQQNTGVKVVRQRSKSPQLRKEDDVHRPCPKTENGNEYIIVVSDYFTKWVEAYAVQDHTALTVADKLCTEFISRFGTPIQIHTDQGREFESELFSQMCKNLDIDKTRCTPYRPNSDGLVEIFNKTLQQMLKVFVNKQRNDWDDYLPYMLMAYRSTIQESTKCTPNLLMFGREINLPLDLMVGGPPNFSDDFCPVEYVEWLKHSLTIVFEFANENLVHSAKRQKRYYDRNIKHREFHSGDFVWRWHPPSANVKLGLGWTGPFKVNRKCSDVTYQIQKLPDSSPIVVHVDHLKPYTGETFPSEWNQSNFEESNLEISLSNESDLPQQPPTPGDLTDVSLESEPGNAGDTDNIGEGITPSTPVRTRCGREIRKPKVYSP